MLKQPQRRPQDANPLERASLQTFGLFEQMKSSGVLFPQVFDENDTIPADFFPSIKAYQGELSRLAKAKRSDGRPIFSGTGLYPEMGADFPVLAHTREHGRLVGMSMHEGEILTGCSLLMTLGIAPAEALGSYVSSGLVRRRLEGDVVESPGGSLESDNIWRIKQARLRIGWSIGARDWRHYGRRHDWENFTFLPSVSGDETVLEDYLGGRKFDYLVLKGSSGYRFKDKSITPDSPIGKWMKTLNEKYLADDAVVALSLLERPLTGLLKDNGYRVLLEPDEREYPEKTTPLYVSDFISRGQLGVKLYRGACPLTFLPRGGFTVLQKAGA